MSKVSSEMLSQTLRMISLARQSALSQGKEQEAEKIAPVENKLRNIVTRTDEEKLPAPGSATLKGADFQHMLEVKQNQNAVKSQSAYDQDRNQIVQSMASGGMSEMEIARQMGMTQEEVEMIVKLGRR